MEIGQMYTFKKSSGRGRPSVGKVVRKAGILTYLELKSGEVISIQTKYLLKPYEFKQYNTKKIKALENSRYSGLGYGQFFLGQVA